GLLIDARRMAAASGAALAIDLRLVPLSEAFLACLGDGREARLAAATAGDDYELLFAAPAGRGREILALSESLGLPLTRIGAVEEGAALHLSDRGEQVPLPEKLGWEHG
ncbi:MAG: AIR synthase-related protein, partial [Pseudomonadota bacterium]|nr:AIR synthase-related protein [Pseudomonadota bacterium]